MALASGYVLLRPPVFRPRIFWWTANRKKITKYEELCLRDGILFRPFAINTFTCVGGEGLSFLQRVAKLTSERYPGVRAEDTAHLQLSALLAIVMRQIARQLLILHSKHGAIQEFTSSTFLDDSGFADSSDDSDRIPAMESDEEGPDYQITRVA